MSIVSKRADLSLWLQWKQISEVVRSAVVADVADASAVSEPELTVLVQLDHAGGTLRQNALVTATGWDRSRLSHLLTRMEDREYLGRTRLRNGVEVAIRPAGSKIISDTMTPLRTAVHRHFSSKLSAEQQQQLADILAALDG